jgi:hypothetical protein
MFLVTGAAGVFGVAPVIASGWLPTTWLKLHYVVMLRPPVHYGGSRPHAVPTSKCTWLGRKAAAFAKEKCELGLYVIGSDWRGVHYGE